MDYVISFTNEAGNSIYMDQDAKNNDTYYWMGHAMKDEGMIVNSYGDVHIVIKNWIFI